MTQQDLIEVEAGILFHLIRGVGKKTKPNQTGPAARVDVYVETKSTGEWQDAYPDENGAVILAPIFKSIGSPAALERAFPEGKFYIKKALFEKPVAIVVREIEHVEFCLDSVDMRAHVPGQGRVLSRLGVRELYDYQQPASIEPSGAPEAPKAVSVELVEADE